MSFDFSWLHLRALDSDVNYGFSMSTVCSLVDSRNSMHNEVHVVPSNSLRNPYWNMSEEAKSSLEDCYTPSFIVLKKKFMSDTTVEQILMCILSKYDDSSITMFTLQDCFVIDEATGGALCLQVYINTL